MKRQFALLFALAFMVSGMATIAEETAADATVETENAATVETAEEAWVAPFEDGAWLGVSELSAEVYLPEGWVVDEVTEDGFTAIDAEAVSSLTVTLADFAETEIAETEGSEESESIELSAFENYLIGLGQEYELALMGEREAAIITSEENLTVLFVQNDRLVTMVFAPAAEGSIADSALAIAETFYVYPEMTETVENAETMETAEAGETAAEE